MSIAYALAVDIGTGGPKVAVVSESGEVIASVARDVPVRFLAGGDAEHDPEDWWRAIIEGSRELLARDEIDPNRIVAVAVTGAWSVTVPVDHEANPIHPAISWMDRRGGKYCVDISSGPVRYEGYDILKLARWLHLCGGLPTHGGADSLAHILFLKHERPDVYQRAHKFLEPMDFITFRLTGRCAAPYGTAFPLWVTDNRDVRNIRYHDGLLRIAGLDRDKLPDLVSPGTVLGPLLPAIAKELGLAESTPVIVSSGDNHSAIIGSGAVADYEGHVYIGTTSWISCHVPFKKTDILHFMTTMPAAIAGRNMVLAQQSTAAECMRWLRDNVIFAGDGLTNGHADTFYDRLDDLVASVPPGSGDLLFLPWLTGAYTPQESKVVRGGFLNLSLQTTRAHMVRAVMEGVALNLQWLLPHVERFVARRFETLNIIGGGAQSRAWCQILADALDRPIRCVAQPRAANVRGAALLAFLALGRIGLDDIASRVAITEEFQPNPANRVCYDRLGHAFQQAFHKNRPIYRALNAHRPPQ